MNPKLKNFVKHLELDYSVEFVPFSKSRNNKEIKSMSDYSINWKVTLSKNGKSLTSDYMQGIGHLSEKYTIPWNRRITVDLANSIKSFCEKGRNNFDKLINPDILDVLYSLVMDSDAINYTFEEWSDNLGYDTDSRNAEKIYNQCLQIGLNLRSLIGNDDLTKLTELFQDY